MAILRIKNPDISKNERTWLTSQYTSGTTLNVQNSNVWANNDLAVVGNPGEELTELTNLSAGPPSNTTMTVVALKFTHNKDAPVYKSKWDQVEISKKPFAGAYAVLATVAIQWDKEETIYDDTAGLTTDTYKFRFKNSIASSYSAYSDELLATGYARNAVSTMVTQVRRKVRDEQAKTYTNEEIIDELDTQQRNIESDHPRAWFLLTTGANITTIAATSLYDLPSDFNYMDVLKYRYVDGNTDITYNLHFISDVEMDDYIQDNNATDRDELRFWTLRPPTSVTSRGQIEVYPTPLTSSLNMTPRYWKKFTTLNSFGDTTELPDPEILENLVAAELEFRAGNQDRGNIWKALAADGMRRLLSRNRRQRGEPGSLFKFVGQKGVRTMFGSGTVRIYTDQMREDYF